ncbi:MAG: hypothetical protein WEA11_06980 [Acidimicrobiales bacterium]
MTDLERLLDLQDNDTLADQLRHRYKALPERGALVELQKKDASIRAAVSEPQAERDGLARDQKRLEDEIAMVEGKAVHVEKQLYDSSMTSPKEAQGLQADLESLKRRQGTLEDEVIELMERIEPLDAQLAQSVVALAAIAGERNQVAASLAASEAEVDSELQTTKAARQALVDSVPASLVAEYERIRGGEGGIGVARLQGATCLGCHISMAAAEVDAMRRLPAQDLAYCSDCGRLLVR